MKKIVLGLAAVAAVSLSVKPSAADPGGYVPPGAAGGGAMPSWAQVAGPNTLLGAGECPPGRGPDRYGLHPCLKKFFHVPTAAARPGAGGYYGPHNPLQDPANWAAGGYGMGGPALNPNGFPPGAYGQMAMGGQMMPGGMQPGMGGQMMPGGMPPGMGGPMMPGGMPGMAGPYAGGQQMMQGTLVFPYNNLIRSPRDFFMWDANK
jgi:hypothetical protein